MNQSEISRLNRIRCAICGDYIEGNPSIDHIYPHEISKWIPGDKVTRIIGSRCNKARTHRECNYQKQDKMPDLDDLFLPQQQKEKLRQRIAVIEPAIRSLMRHKQGLLDKQENLCYGCKEPMTEMGILRRINPKKIRSWENACIVCRKCNDEKEAFIL